MLGLHIRLAFAPLFPPRLWGPPSPSGIKFCHEILETIGYHMVLNWYRVVMDGRTDRQTELP